MYHLKFYALKNMLNVFIKKKKGNAIIRNFGNKMFENLTKNILRHTFSVDGVYVLK